MTSCIQGPNFTFGIQGELWLMSGLLGLARNGSGTE